MHIIPVYKLLHPTTLVFSMLLFFLKDEDPALRELAELERDSCLQDIQDLSQKVKLTFQESCHSIK